MQQQQLLTGKVVSCSAELEVAAEEAVAAASAARHWQGRQQVRSSAAASTAGHDCAFMLPGVKPPAAAAAAAAAGAHVFKGRLLCSGPEASAEALAASRLQAASSSCNSDDNYRSHMLFMSNNQTLSCNTW
jgi:hypothetical protein